MNFMRGIGKTGAPVAKEISGDCSAPAVPARVSAARLGLCCGSQRYPP